MIPKQLFFIWLGDNKPNYVDFAVNTFKGVNPDFKVDLIEWKIEDIENPSDELLKRSVDEAIKLMTDNTVMDILHGRRAFKIIAIIEGILILVGEINKDADGVPLKD